MTDDRAGALLQARAALRRAPRPSSATTARRILGYLTSVLRNDGDAADVFSQFTEDLWRGLPGFRGECPVRVWAYRLAWHAAARHLRDPFRQRGRALETTELSRIAEEVRSSVLLGRREARRQGIDKLREQLAPDEQTLLVLRLDRELSWREVATVLADDGEAVDEAALRKRFERLKGKLARARARGGAPRVGAAPRWRSPIHGRPRPLPPSSRARARRSRTSCSSSRARPRATSATSGRRFAAGQQVGRFELLREVGRGGFGVVFEARDTELGRLVAFKAMRPSRARRRRAREPLREEAEAAARLNHPNVVTLHDYGLHEGTPFLILELLRGETLQQRLRRGALAPSRGACGSAGRRARPRPRARAGRRSTAT